MDKASEKGKEKKKSGDEKRGEKGNEFKKVRCEENEVREVERVRQNEGTEEN